jgi:hypothetical protein
MISRRYFEYHIAQGQNLKRGELAQEFDDGSEGEVPLGVLTILEALYGHAFELGENSWPEGRVLAYDHEIPAVYLQGRQCGAAVPDFRDRVVEVGIVQIVAIVEIAVKCESGEGRRTVVLDKAQDRGKRRALVDVEIHVLEAM